MADRLIGRSLRKHRRELEAEIGALKAERDQLQKKAWDEGFHAGCSCGAVDEAQTQQDRAERAAALVREAFEEGWMAGAGVCDAYSAEISAPDAAWQASAVKRTLEEQS